jgi:hypothetical protein
LTFFTSLFVTLSVQSSHEGLVDGTCNIWQLRRVCNILVGKPESKMRRWY